MDASGGVDELSEAGTVEMPRERSLSVQLRPVMLPCGGTLFCM